ncbi:hypothetical protein KIPB_012536, partial [Kipferlia bialata]|eukprot:g12536.t1
MEKDGATDIMCLGGELRSVIVNKYFSAPVCVKHEEHPLPEATVVLHCTHPPADEDREEWRQTLAGMRSASEHCEAFYLYMPCPEAALSAQDREWIGDSLGYVETIHVEAPSTVDVVQVSPVQETDGDEPPSRELRDLSGVERVSEALFNTMWPIQ